MMIILHSWNTVREFSSSTGLTGANKQLAPEPFFATDSDVICLQAEARRTKVKEARKRREERQVLKKEEMLKVNISSPPPHLFSNAHFLVHCWRCSRQGGPGQEVDHCRHCHCKVFLLNKAYNTPHHFTIFILSLKCYCGTLTDVSSYCTFCNVVFLVFQSTQSDVQRGNNTLSSLLLFLISSNSH